MTSPIKAIDSDFTNGGQTWCQIETGAQVEGGYYSDPEAECQAFHVCTADGLGGLAKYSFLCPNGTLFSQEYFICDWWFNFDCSTAEDLYRHFFVHQAPKL